MPRIFLILALASCDAPAASDAPPFDYCAPEEPPDAACFASRRDPASPELALARRIADRQLAHDPTEIRWDWGETVLMLGLVAVARVTGEPAYRDHAAAWIDHHVEGGYRIVSSDTAAPAAVALALLHETGEARYARVVDDARAYLDEVALRTDEGGINHFGALDVLGVTLWIDSLFMFGNVLTGWGEHAGDAAALDGYAEQFAIFTELLQSDGGLYSHAYDTVFPQEEGVYWGRGNGWVTAAGFDHLRVRRNRGEDVAPMRDALARQVAAILELQDPETGLWWTVLNRPGESYLETSAAALFAFGLARGYRYGQLGAEVLPAIRRAVAGVRARVVDGADGEPVVTGASGPTNPGTFDDYADVPQTDDVSYGVGAVLLALTEASGLPTDAEEGE